MFYSPLKINIWNYTSGSLNDLNTWMWFFSCTDSWASFLDWITRQLPDFEDLFLITGKFSIRASSYNFKGVIAPNTSNKGLRFRIKIVRSVFGELNYERECPTEESRDLLFKLKFGHVHNDYDTCKIFWTIFVTIQNSRFLNLRNFYL